MLANKGSCDSMLPQLGKPNIRRLYPWRSVAVACPGGVLWPVLLPAWLDPHGPLADKPIGLSMIPDKEAVSSSTQLLPTLLPSQCTTSKGRGRAWNIGPGHGHE